VRENYDFLLELFADQPEEAERVIAHLLLLKWGFSRLQPGQDSRNALLPHMQTCLYDLLQLKPVLGLNFDRGIFFVDWNYSQAQAAPLDHVALCDTLRSSQMTGPLAVETLRYAATLVQHLIIHLHDHILQQEASFENGLFDPSCDTPFDILWKQLAVGAGSKLTQAISRIRCVPFPLHTSAAHTHHPSRNSSHAPHHPSRNSSHAQPRRHPVFRKQHHRHVL
jgi:hypothetical protein